MTKKKKATKNLPKTDPLTAKMEALEAELLATQEKLKEAEEARLRALADLQNFQRRQTAEKADWGRFAVVNFLKPFLPRFLELQIGIQHSTDEDAQKVVKKFFESLEKQGLTKIEPREGEALNTDFHEVLMQAEGEAGTVVSCLEPGWIFGETVITPAKVSGAA